MIDLKKDVLEAILKNNGDDVNEIPGILELIDENKWKIEGLTSENIEKLNKLLPDSIYGFMLEALLIDYVPEEGNDHIYESEEFDKLTEVGIQNELTELLKDLNEEETVKYLEKILINKNLDGFIQVELGTILKNIGIKKFLEVILENNGEHIVEDIFKQTRYIQ